jgi:hypothetical protein
MKAIVIGGGNGGLTGAIYTHEWTSFTTKNFPENAVARNGDVVPIMQISGPLKTFLWTDESYREVYREAGLEAVQVFEPLAKVTNPIRG